MPGIEIPATAEYLSHINHATCLAKDGVRIETIEHLLAALNALGVDNVVVELDGPEVPIMDGSAAPFIYLIHEAGIRTLSASRSYLGADAAGVGRRRRSLRRGIPLR